MDPEIREWLRTELPQFDEPEVLERLTNDALSVSLRSGARVIGPGDPIRAIPLVVRGTVRVSRVDHDGRELLLYYIRPGESCAMTLVSFLCNQHSGIHAEAVDHVSAVMIPITTADALMRRSPSWREFTYQQVQRSYDLLLQTIDTVAFHPLKDRVSDWLRRHHELKGAVLEVTHQTIADDLGTSREVVSRLLKQLERDGAIVLRRNEIEILSL